MLLKQRALWLTTEQIEQLRMIKKLTGVRMSFVARKALSLYIPTLLGKESQDKKILAAVIKEYRESEDKLEGMD